MKALPPSPDPLVLAAQLHRELEARLQKNDDRFSRPRRQLRDLYATRWQPGDQASAGGSSPMGGR